MKKFIEINKAAQNHPNCILTYTGKFLNVFDAKESEIEVEDIAVALSRIPRFAGHLNNNVSVGQHSIDAYLLAKRKKMPLSIQFQALFHDSAEAYILDLPSPIKAMLPQYKEIENNLLSVISKKIGFKYPFDSEIKEIDFELLKKEWNDSMFSKYENINSDLVKTEFLSCYRNILAEINLRFDETL